MKADMIFHTQLDIGAEWLDDVVRRSDFVERTRCFKQFCLPGFKLTEHRHVFRRRQTREPHARGEFHLDQEFDAIRLDINHRRNFVGVVSVG